MAVGAPLDRCCCFSSPWHLQHPRSSPLVACWRLLCSKLAHVLSPWRSHALLLPPPIRLSERADHPCPCPFLLLDFLHKENVRVGMIDWKSKYGKVSASTEVGVWTPVVGLVSVLLPAAVPGNSPVAHASKRPQKAVHVGPPRTPVR